MPRALPQNGGLQMVEIHDVSTLRFLRQFRMNPMCATFHRARRWLLNARIVSASNPIAGVERSTSRCKEAEPKTGAYLKTAEAISSCHRGFRAAVFSKLSFDVILSRNHLPFFRVRGRGKILDQVP